MEIESKNFNETDVFTRELEPLLGKLHDLCNEHNLPYAVFVQYGQTDDPDQPDTRSRAIMCVQHVTIPERTCPLLNAVAMATHAPRAAAVAMLIAAVGTHDIQGQDQHEAGHA